MDLKILQKHKTFFAVCGISGSCLAFLWWSAARKHDNIKVVENFQFYFGHLNMLREFYEDSFYDRCYDMLVKYSHLPIVSFSVPMQTYVSLLDPKYIEYIWTTNFTSATKSDVFNEKFEPMLGDGIFNVDGEIWKRHRQIASKIFTMRSLRDYMFECFINTTNDFMAKISELTGDVKTKYEEELTSVNISDMFARLTLEAFTFIAFGVQVDCIKKAPEVLEFPKAFDAAFVACTRRWLDPLYKLKRALNVSTEKELKQHVSMVNRFVDDIIVQREQTKDRSELAKRYDLISLFLTDSPEDQKLTRKELRDITVNFIIAGRDTTASLLTWVCYELALHPEIQDKILKEVQTVKGDKDNEEITFDHVSKMEYLEAVLLEALRLHPSVPSMVRFAQEDIKMPGGEIIRKGDGIVIFAYALARFEKIWEKPFVFNPERFLNRSTPYPAYYYHFFNVKPRLCLGKPVALMEAKIAIAKVLSKYQLRLKPGQKFIPIFSATLQLKEGMEMYFIPRK